jgi:hypothetical protein
VRSPVAHPAVASLTTPIHLIHKHCRKGWMYSWNSAGSIFGMTQSVAVNTPIGPGVRVVLTGQCGYSRIYRSCPDAIRRLPMVRGSIAETRDKGPHKKSDSGDRKSSSTGSLQCGGFYTQRLVARGDSFKLLWRTSKLNRGCRARPCVNSQRIQQGVHY